MRKKTKNVTVDTVDDLASALAFCLAVKKDFDNGLSSQQIAEKHDVKITAVFNALYVISVINTEL